MATCVAHLVPARHEGAGRAVLWVCGRLFGPLGRSRRARLGVFRAGRGGGSGLGGRIAIDAWAIIAGPPSCAWQKVGKDRGETPGGNGPMIVSRGLVLLRSCELREHKVTHCIVAPMRETTDATGQTSNENYAPD